MIKYAIQTCVSAVSPLVHLYVQHLHTSTFKGVSNEYPTLLVDLD